MLMFLLSVPTCRHRIEDGTERIIRPKVILRYVVSLFVSLNMHWRSLPGGGHSDLRSPGRPDTEGLRLPMVCWKDLLIESPARRCPVRL